MNNLKIKKRLYHYTSLKILSFISNQLGEVFSAKEISQVTRSSKGATNQILRLLLELDILSRERKGNLFLYKLNADSLVLRQFKIFENLLGLKRLLKDIQKYCYEIVLFGSCADGSNTKESDIDLFIVTEYKKEVRRIVAGYQTMDVKYQAVIQDPLEFVSSKKDDGVFHGQIKRGITIWKGRPTCEEI
jgi:predicted nucleotidyltransferase